MKEKTPTNPVVGTTSTAGYAFVSSTAEPYYVGRVDAKSIYELSSNLYVSGPVTQTTNLVVSGEPTIEVYDENGDPVEDISRDITAMFSKPGCSMAAMCRSLLPDLLIWGVCIYNWVWERSGSKIVCTALNRIHPYNFSQAPSAAMNGVTFGRLLEGIVYDRVGRKTHYYHRQDAGVPFEVPERDLLVVRDPASDYPDGKSVIYSMAPIIEYINYAWNALGQQMFRTSAPTIFIKITDPKPERIVGGKKVISDVDYANEIMSKWGKDYGYSLRENFEVIKVDVTEGSLAIRSIDFAQQTIRDYLNPNGMLGKDGALISGSSDASLRLLNNSISGWVTLMETSMSEIPEYYLRHNGYPDSYHAKVRMPKTAVEDWNRKLQTAQLGVNAHVLTVNEVRELIGREGLSDEELAKIDEEWKLVSPQLPQTPIIPSGYVSHSSPGRGAMKKRAEIASSCCSKMEEATDELERKIRSAIRSELEG